MLSPKQERGYANLHREHNLRPLTITWAFFISGVGEDPASEVAEAADMVWS